MKKRDKPVHVRGQAVIIVGAIPRIHRHADPCLEPAGPQAIGNEDHEIGHFIDKPRVDFLPVDGHSCRLDLAEMRRQLLDESVFLRSDRLREKLDPFGNPLVVGEIR